MWPEPPIAAVARALVVLIPVSALIVVAMGVPPARHWSGAMRRVRPIAVTILAMALLIPLSVLTTVAMGIPARHWSGAHLDDVRWNGDGEAGTNAFPEGRQGHYTRTPAQEDAILHAVPESPGEKPQVVLGGRDDVHDCVLVVVARIDNTLFERLGPYADAVCVVYSPREGIAYEDGGGAGKPTEVPSTYWDPSTLPARYWVLLTGFPLHIGAMLLLAALVWTVLPLVRRMRAARRRSPPPAGAPRSS